MWLMLIYPVLAMLLRILDVDRQRGLLGVEGLQDQFFSNGPGFDPAPPVDAT